MLLKFRIETRKIKQPRIVVLRLSNENGKPVEKSLGSFSSKRGYEHIVKQLSSEELYEFENFVKTTEFAKKIFNCNADRLDRFIIKVAPGFKDALFQIWKKAKEYNIDFVPEHEMLLAIFHRAKVVEQQLSVLTNGEFQAFSKLNIDITNLHPPKPNIREDQKLISSVLENAKSPELLADMFNTIAEKKYHKAPKFKPHHFDYFVSQLEQEKKQSFPKWYYTIAIDVLCDLGVKPDTIISPAQITEHWLRLNKKESFDKTISAFNQQFKHLKDNLICTNVIKESFIKDQIARMSQTVQGNLVSPSIAAKQWIVKHSCAHDIDTIKSFNKEFPLLADNQFFINLIKKKSDA
jgi:hypothetical protein